MENQYENNSSVILKGLTRKVDDNTYEAFGKNVASITTNHVMVTFNLHKVRREKLCHFRGSAILDSF
jgi:hypothetical protein